jgi:signal transduction histidine kinase
MAHEFRTPLAVIMNSVYHLGRAGRDDQTAEIHDRIARQAGRMSRLVDDLVDHSRIAGSGVRLEVAEVDVREAMERAVEAVRPAAEAKGQSLQTSCTAEGLRIEADPHRLEQILGNLLSNAVRYTPPGGEIELAALQEDRHVVFRVRDSGIGFDPTRADQLFQPFVQMEHDDARSSEGLGLGLWLVKALTESHGGEASCASDGPGRGSEFLVRMPRLSRDRG